MRKSTCLLVGLLFLTLTVHAQNTLIYCGTLIDGSSDKAQKEVTVVINGKQILEIVKGYKEAGSEDQVIDLKNSTVLPGFIDLHVHIEGETSRGRYLDRFTKNPADVAFNSTIYARRTLMAGFTTVRDVGGSGVNISLRDAINRGIIVGPRIFTAGKGIGTTGGHADPTNGFKASLMGDPGPAEGVINGPDEARKAVRQRYKNGADVIKITATGGVVSLARDGKRPQFTSEELRAIVETANDYGMITAAHAHGAEGMKRAVEAGITTIEHGTFMDEEVMDLMIKMGTYYVPTISAGRYIADKAKEDKNYYPPQVAAKALEIGPKIQGTFEKAYKRGVKIAFGTDAAVYPHGQNAKEFGYMVESGMPPMEAIQSATSVASTVLRMQDKFGTVEAGKMADIIAVPGDPLKDISVLENVQFVMKEGEIFKNE